MGRERRRTNGDEVRAQDRAKDRTKKNARRREWIQENREEHLRKRQEWKAKNPESVKRSQDKANAKRAQAKRDYMHLYVTKYVGIGCEPPKCRKCGEEVPFGGVGRPRLDCLECRARAEVAA